MMRKRESRCNPLNCKIYIHSGVYTSYDCDSGDKAWLFLWASVPSPFAFIHVPTSIQSPLRHLYHNEWLLAFSFTLNVTVDSHLHYRQRISMFSILHPVNEKCPLHRAWWMIKSHLVALTGNYSQGWIWGQQLAIEFFFQELFKGSLLRDFVQQHHELSTQGQPKL